jgi:hypothetical protein
MEPGGSLLCSQERATSAYADEFIPHLRIILFNVNFNIILPSTVRSPSGLFPPGF